MFYKTNTRFYTQECKVECFLFGITRFYFCKNCGNIASTENRINGKSMLISGGAAGGYVKCCPPGARQNDRVGKTLPVLTERENAF